MNLILLDAADFVTPTRVRVTGRRATHIHEVLRARAGDVLRVGLLGGVCGSATLLLLDETGAELDVALDQAPPEPSPIRLVLALPRPPALRRVLRTASAFGVKHIALLHSARVEKSFWQSSQLRPAELEEQLRIGLEQARDTLLPSVTRHRSFRDFAERELPPFLAEGPALVGDPGATEPCPHAFAGRLTVIVGPEGGFLEREVALLERQGVRRVGLGVRPLPVDTAVIALLARLTP